MGDLGAAQHQYHVSYIDQHSSSCAWQQHSAAAEIVETMICQCMKLGKEGWRKEGKMEGGRESQGGFPPRLLFQVALPLSSTSSESLSPFLPDCLPWACPSSPLSFLPAVAAS